MNTKQLIELLNAGWSTLWVAGNTRAMFHRAHGIKHFTY